MAIKHTKKTALTLSLAWIFMVGVAFTSFAKAPLDAAAIKRCVGFASELADRANIYVQDAERMKADLGPNPTAKAKAEYLKFDSATKEKVGISTKVIAKYFGGKPFPPGNAEAHKAKDDAVVAETKACL